MQRDVGKKVEKIINRFKNIGKLPTAIIKYGSVISLILFAAGTALFVYNKTGTDYTMYKEFVSMSIVECSFTLLAEAIIGGLLIDFVLGKKT
jgi:hypothetical protein